MKLPKNFSFPRWRIFISSLAIFDFLGGVGSEEPKSVGVPRRRVTAVGTLGRTQTVGASVPELQDE